MVKLLSLSNKSRCREERECEGGEGLYTPLTATGNDIRTSFLCFELGFHFSSPQGSLLHDLLWRHRLSRTQPREVIVRAVCLLCSARRHKSLIFLSICIFGEDREGLSNLAAVFSMNWKQRGDDERAILTTCEIYIPLRVDSMTYWLWNVEFFVSDPGAFLLHEREHGGLLQHARGHAAIV